MINFAVIGTNWITESFIEGAHKSKMLLLTAVYSRQLNRAMDFAKQYESVTCFDDLALLANSDVIDAVYIASPNSLHYQQTIQLLKAGKHVICEKPLGSNLTEVEEMYRVAQESGVILFEAFKTPYLPNFAVIKDNLSRLGAIRKATISYCQYSSRYQKYLNGENPNTFNPMFSNGSVMDIGYYCIASAIALFGEPLRIQASAYLLDTGVDAQGSVILSYDGFDAVINHSKVSDSSLPSEIQGEEGSLTINHISQCYNVYWNPRGGNPEELTVDSVKNSMQYEAEFFAKQIRAGKRDEGSVERSLLTAKVITEVRRLTGVVYPSDE
ncbi:MAG: Gfo/Idh/MocA family oxidoreductase [Aliivibrio sp.]|uniref:Gfo/Idh/MocA family protein n=1 Tax=Aliivibrio sp. TaxID=1872443 RepID=UPI001A45C87F|nr:Gfo/Idh/MocA family oxidoreductase [Aliivibrio sp.]